MLKAISASAIETRFETVLPTSFAVRFNYEDVQIVTEPQLLMHLLLFLNSTAIE